MKRGTKKPYTGRDYALVLIICGATKSGAHKNHRKEENKKFARKRITYRKDDACF